MNSISFDTSNTADFNIATAVGAFNASNLSTTPQTHQLFDLTDSTARYIRLNVLSNHGSNTYSMLGEIAFDVSSPAPVPVPAAVWLLGSALMGLVAMRKRKAG